MADEQIDYLMAEVEERDTEIAALKAALVALCDATANWAANSYDVNSARQNAWTVLAAVSSPGATEAGEP